MRPEQVLARLTPESWLRCSARRVFSNATDRSADGDVQLSASQRFGIVPQERLMEDEDQKYMLALGGTENFKHVEPGDFVISLRSFEGGFEYSPYRGCVSPAYTVLRPRVKVEGDYFRHVFKSGIFRQMLAAFNVGVRDGKSIRYDDFAEFLLALPPAIEQRRIAAFLDRETARIDALIEKKTRFIELLREKRQALITRAVSGWPPRPLKFSSEFLTSGPRGWSEMIVDAASSIFVQSGDLTDDMQLAFDGAARIIAPEGAEADRTRLRPGDVVVCITGANTGRVALAEEAPLPAYINQHLCLIRPSRPVLQSRFLALVLHSKVGRDYFDQRQYGLKEGLSLSDIGNAPIPLPPLAEQSRIVVDCASQVASIQSIVDAAQRSISLLRERRAALITAAVTGQIDVRAEQPTEDLEPA